MTAVAAMTTRGAYLPPASVRSALAYAERVAASIPDVRELEKMLRLAKKFGRHTNATRASAAEKAAARTDYLRSLAEQTTWWVSSTSPYLDQRTESFAVTLRALSRLLRTPTNTSKRRTSADVTAVQDRISALSIAPGAPPAPSRPQLLGGLSAVAA
jgi:hypothetical protein